MYSSLNPQQRNSLLMLLMAGLLFWVSMASLLPTLPLYIEHVGATKQQIGIIMGAFALGLLPARAWLGPIADNKGRKIVLLLGPVVAAIAPLGYLFFTSIGGLILLRAFHGISIAAFTTGYSALVTDIAPKEKRGELLGYMTLAQPVGVALGPAIGGYLLEGTQNYFALFLMAASAAVLAFLACLPITEPNKELFTTSHSQKTTHSQQTFWQILASDALRIPALTMFVVGLVFGVIHTFMPLYLKASGTNLNAGLFYTVAAMGSFIIRVLIGRASDRYGRGLFITGSLICYLTAMLVIWRATTPTEFLIGALLEGFASGTIFPMMIALISDRCLPQQRAQFLSLGVGGLDLGMILSGPIMGFIAEYTGYRHLFGIATFFSLLALSIFTTLSSHTIPSSFKFALGRGRDVYALHKG